MKAKIAIAFVINACIAMPVIAADIYRWTDPETGKTVTTPSLPPYPIKEQRPAGGLPGGNLVNVILDTNAPAVKAIVEKRKVREAEERKITEEKQKEKLVREAEQRKVTEKEQEERKRIAAQKAKEDAEYKEKYWKQRDAEREEESRKAAARLAARDYEENYKTTATELFSDYEKNEVNTDEKIKGKIVEISGSVQSIDKDFTDSIIVKLKTSNEFMPARLRIDDSQKQNAMMLNKGDEVTIRCQKMSRIMGSPSGRDCKF